MGMNSQPYRLPNGCMLLPGCRIRMPAEQIWMISEADIIKYGLELEHENVTPGSEVIYRRTE